MIKKFKYFNKFIAYCSKLRKQNKSYSVYAEKGIYYIDFI